MAASDAVQYLSNILQQSGPHALPYEETAKWTIRQQVCTAIAEFTGLQVKPAPFTHNDGRTVSLLQLHGTVPMQYQGSKYNIPVSIWLLEGFPRAAPLVYVTPTREMVIQPFHPFVDPSGQVDIPYLREWLSPRSNLVEMIRVCSTFFGREPPLYSRGAVPPPSYTPPPPPPSWGPSYHYQAPTQEDPDEVFKRNAIMSLTERFQRDISRHVKDAQQEMEQQLSVQQTLTQRAEEIDGAVRQLTHEKGALEDQLQVLLTNTQILEQWLKENDKGNMEIDIDAAFEPSDLWSKQTLETASADLAIEDILYALEKAVQEDDNGRRILSVDFYLKQIRSLSREQFMHRAVMMKVRAQQAQNRVAAMAVRGSYQERSN